MNLHTTDLGRKQVMDRFQAQSTLHELKLTDANSPPAKAVRGGKWQGKQKSAENTKESKENDAFQIKKTKCGQLQVS